MSRLIRPRTLSLTDAHRTRVRWVAGAMSATVAAMLLVTTQAWAADHGGHAGQAAPAANVAPPVAAPVAQGEQRPPREQTGQMRHHGMAKDGQGGKGHGGMMGMPGQYVERMLDKVQATPEQRSAIRTVMERHRSQHRGLHEQGRALHQEALNLWAQPTLDEKAADRLRMRMNAHHQQMSAANMAMMLEVGRILTPEQRAQMAQQLRERHNKMPRHPGGPR